MQFHPWWHSGTHSCPSSSLLHDFFPSDTVGPTSSLVLPWWHSETYIISSSSLVLQLDPAQPIFFPTCKFVSGGTVRPIPAKLLLYFTISSKWHSGARLLSSSFLVVQWDPPLPNFFPACNFIHGGTVGPTPALVLPYFTISSLVAQWDLHPL